MSVATDINEGVEMELRATKYPQFRVATGGKGPPEPPDTGANWLGTYAIGTTFVCRSKTSRDPDFNLYHLVFKWDDEVVLLKWELPDGKILDYYVNPAKFSKKFEDPYVLGVVKIPKPEELEQQAEGEEDGNSNRPD